MARRAARRPPRGSGVGRDTRSAPGRSEPSVVPRHAADILTLQRSVGNQAVCRLLQRDRDDSASWEGDAEKAASAFSGGDPYRVASGAPTGVYRLIGTGLHSPGRPLEYQARVHRILTERIAQNPRFMLAAARAFLSGVMAGTRANLSGEDLRAFERRFQMSLTFPIPRPPFPIPLPIKPPVTAGFLAGTVVGVVQGLVGAVRDLVQIVTRYGGDPQQIAEDFLSLLEALLSPGAEEAVHATGEQTGAQFASRVRALARADDTTFGFEMGKLVGPTLATVVLALVTGGGGAVARGVVALAGRLSRLARFRAVANRLRALGGRLGLRRGAVASRPPGGAPGRGPLVRPGTPGRPPTPEEAARTAPLPSPGAAPPARAGTPAGGRPAGGTPAPAAAPGAAPSGELRPIGDLAQAQRMRDQWIRDGRPFEMTPDPDVYRANWHQVGGVGEPPPAYLRGDRLVFNPRRTGPPSPEAQAAREALVAGRGRPAPAPAPAAGAARAPGTRWRQIGDPVPPPVPQTRAGSTLPPIDLNPEVRPIRQIRDVDLARSFREEHVGAGGRYMEKFNRAMHQEDWFNAGGPGTAPPAYVTEAGVLVYDANVLGPLPESLLGRRPGRR